MARAVSDSLEDSGVPILSVTICSFALISNECFSHFNMTEYSCDIIRMWEDSVTIYNLVTGKPNSLVKARRFVNHFCP